MVRYELHRLVGVVDKGRLKTVRLVVAASGCCWLAFTVASFLAQPQQRPTCDERQISHSSRHFRHRWVNPTWPCVGFLAYLDKHHGPATFLHHQPSVARKSALSILALLLNLRYE